MNKFEIIAKLDKDDKIIYAKAKVTENILKEPIINNYYFFCGVRTSNVKSFFINSNKLTIHTENSKYICWIDILDNINLFVKKNNLPEVKKLNDNIMYWGFDERISTYIIF